MAKKFKVPKEFFLELEELAQAIREEIQAGKVAPQTRVAYCNLVSWFPYLDATPERPTPTWGGPEAA